MRRNTSPAVLMAAALALAVGCASGSPPAAGLVPWDQARAQALASELSSAADAWELEVRQANPDRLGAGSSEEGMGLTERARLVSEQARALAGHLNAGRGRDQTYHDFRSLKEHVDDIEVDQARTALGEQVPLAWARVKRPFEALEPYYLR